VRIEIDTKQKTIRVFEAIKLADLIGELAGMLGVNKYLEYTLLYHVPVYPNYTYTQPNITWTTDKVLCGTTSCEAVINNG